MSMKRLLLLAAAGSLIALLSTSANAQDLFDFENVRAIPSDPITAFPVVMAEGASIRTLTLTQSGLTALPSNTSGFTFLDNNSGGVVAFGNNLSNIVVGNAGDRQNTLETLTLTFDQAVSGLTFQFVTFPAGFGVPIELNASTDSGLSFSSTGVPNGTSGNGEGSITLSGGLFTIVTLSLNTTPQMGGTGAVGGDTFLVDNFLVTPSVISQVPEPGSVAMLLGMGLPVAWGLRRQSRQKRNVGTGA